MLIAAESRLREGLLRKFILFFKKEKAGCCFVLSTLGIFKQGGRCSQLQLWGQPIKNQALHRGKNGEMEWAISIEAIL